MAKKIVRPRFGPEVQKIYKKEVTRRTFRIASVHNNRERHREYPITAGSGTAD